MTSMLQKDVGTADLSASGDVLARFAAVTARLASARSEVRRVIIGQDAVIDQCLAALLAGGHALIVGVPGLGKTKLVEALAASLGLSTRRIQCTPDLMPADILGSEVLEQAADGTRGFRFIEGPVFTELLMADEINRASPRTQSALLQAMAEHRVAVAGLNRALPAPFHVLATQNPLEQEGTYPLPEAQLDRFLFEIRIDYPALADERAMLLATTGTDEASAAAALGPDDLLAAQRLVRAMPVGELVLEAILRLVRGARPETAIIPDLAEALAWGPGPRAAQALMLSCRARALLDGREAPSLDDVAELAAPVLRHRMGLSFAARAEGVGVETLIASVVAKALG
ncbi:MoxR family ATPase [Acidiphilium sp. AL]|uniref:MoxR family ATPase n=1 Tax=Acidiphilium iwatense TaxID=768198 RepID=A0ABS9E2K8_9PROT|nr:MULTISPECIES: MoxR family ATPase [Acidiphilium]MCF3948573.1 MoxR family ATPase [Acidiphilium iwatense]MCU4161957.1 MoxR family ATPase [Acidiphilium sp. AL]